MANISTRRPSFEQKHPKATRRLITAGGVVAGTLPPLGIAAGGALGYRRAVRKNRGRIGRTAYAVGGGLLGAVPIFGSVAGGRFAHLLAKNRYPVTKRS